MGLFDFIGKQKEKQQENRQKTQELMDAYGLTEDQLTMDKARQIFQDKIDAIVPAGSEAVLILASTMDLKNDSYYLWRDGEKLCLFPTVPKTKILDDFTQYIRTIPLADIHRYEPIGEVYHETKITGGGGGGVSLGGAVVGNALGGAAGAVLMGRKKNQPIHSKDVAHDTRQIRMLLSGGRMIHFWFTSMDVLHQVIPEKAADFLDAQRLQAANAPASTADELKKYKDLLDAGALSQEEFDAIKKKLLDL